MKKENKHPKVSVIIPAYNAERFIQRCLDSIFGQTVKPYEVIVVNDGSTDDTLGILKKNEKNHAELKIVDQENSGQGVARNRALDVATGEYVLFVDSDDWINEILIKESVERAKKDESDVVHFDWRYSSVEPANSHAFSYVNEEPFANQKILQGDNCDELLRVKHFFAWSNLYKKSFLDEYRIRFGEGYIYEDNVFVTLIANRAKRISIIPSPLYVFHRNMESTTRNKIGYKDDRHYKGFLRAIEESIQQFKPRTRYSAYYLAVYFQTKFFFYYERRRIPRNLRAKYISKYLDLMSELESQVVFPPAQGERVLRLCVEYKIYSRKRFILFYLLTIYKAYLIPLKTGARASLKKLKRAIRAIFKEYRQELKRPIIKDSILFLGFDYRYAGNSRYLFEEMVHDDRFRDKEIRFVTDSTYIDSRYKIIKDGKDFNKWLARAETIISESWVPHYIARRDETTLIQLWHGTPLKRMLFDAAEKEVMDMNPRNKINKHRNIMKWDYLLSDSPAGTKKFRSSFLLPREKIIETGYPRVKYLINNTSNSNLKDEIKTKAKLPKDRKIIFYAPTWRDYNYGKEPESMDTSYILNISKLAERLGDEYIILFKDHDFINGEVEPIGARCIDVSDCETQELLLISDHVITDYSSIMFDAFAIDIPVTIYANDFKRYEESRGVYEDMWQDLSFLQAKDMRAVEEAIKKPLKAYDKKLKEKYVFNSKVDLLDFLNKITQSNNRRKKIDAVMERIQ